MFAPFVETMLSVRSLIVWLPALGRKQPPFQKISAVEPVWKFPVVMTSACITPPCRFRRELAPYRPSTTFLFVPSTTVSPPYMLYVARAEGAPPPA